MATHPVQEPLTMGDNDMHCDPQCPFLTHGEQMCQATCGRDGKPLDFYDFYLASCKGQESGLGCSIAFMC